MSAPAGVPAAAASSAASSAASRRAANRRGIEAMLAAMAVFTVNEALVKYVGSTLPVAQLVFVRGAMVVLLALAAAYALGALRELRTVADRWVAVRAGFDAVATLVYLVSLLHLPLPNAVAIGLAAPLFVTGLAVILHREHVDAPRWIAVAVGFAGVLLVIQPSAAGFDAWALVCLLATLLHALRDVLTRRIPPAAPALLITLATNAAVTLLACIVASFQGWQPVAAPGLGLLAASAALLLAGHVMMIRATRAGELSAIAPFRYSSMLWALLLGWAVWGDVPNATAWAGIALLVGAGLYTVRRERALTRS